MGGQWGGWVSKMKKMKQDEARCGKMKQDEAR